MLQDPDAKKPEDWVDEAQIPDPADVKPDDWEQPETILDPEASQPEDWDVEEDGEWEAPRIPNPAYKGEWQPKMIDNPAYKGEWEVGSLLAITLCLAAALSTLKRPHSRLLCHHVSDAFVIQHMMTRSR